MDLQTLFGLQIVVTDLIANDHKSLIFKLLDTYYATASKLEDYDTLGALALKSDHRQLYLKCAESAYAIAATTEQKYAARTNLYKAYNIMNDPHKALFYIQLNLNENPDDFDAHCHQMANYALAGDRDKAEELADQVAIKFADKDLKGLFSYRMLKEGKLSEGLSAFVDQDKNPSRLFHNILHMKRWDGVAKPGSKIYVDAEGGIGDNIINIRFFKQLKEMGMEPILYHSWKVDKTSIVDVLRSNGFTVLTDSISIDTTQCWIPLMSLPIMLKLKENDLWYGTYLKAKSNPKNKIHSTGFKIGIKCSGNPYFAQDEYRKIPLDTMLKYIPDVEIYYIDKETVDDPRVVNLSNRIESWDDTLDFIEQMDCIVSSCTSLVHAAGALGKRTFVITPISEYYIWTTSDNTTHSPWYGSNFQIHRQTKLHSWDEPLRNVRIELNSLVGSRPAS